MLLAVAIPCLGEVRLRILVEGDPVEVGPGAAIEIAARPTGAFAVALERDSNLVVRAFDAAGAEEFVKNLRSLGYSGGSNVRGLVPLRGYRYGVGWNVDHHYAGIQSSSVALVGGAGVQRVLDQSRRLVSPTVTSDGAGGLFAVARDSTEERMVFRRWTAEGSLAHSGPVPLRGSPIRAASFRGGVALLFRDAATSTYAIAWLDRQGRVIEQAAARGSLATDGYQLADLLSLASEVVVRFGASPRSLGPPRKLVAAPEGRVIVGASLAGDSWGRWVLTWSTCDLSYAVDTCRLHLRSFDRLGRSLGPPVQLDGVDGGVLGTTVTASGPGRFLVAGDEYFPDRVVGHVRVWRLRLTAEADQPGGRP